MNKLKVGQTVYIVEKYRQDTINYTITKVGRVRAFFGDWGSYVDMRSMSAFSSRGDEWGKAWLSLADYERHQENVKAWQSFKSELARHWAIPDDMTAERIAQARELLGLK